MTEKFEMFINPESVDVIVDALANECERKNSALIRKKSETKELKSMVGDLEAQNIELLRQLSVYKNTWERQANTIKNLVKEIKAGEKTILKISTLCKGSIQAMNITNTRKTLTRIKAIARKHMASMTNKVSEVKSIQGP